MYQGENKAKQKQENMKEKEERRTNAVLVRG